MVKIGFYVVRKPGKKGVHEYEEVCLRFPKEMHEFLRCLRYRSLRVEASRDGKRTHIILIEEQA